METTKKTQSSAGSTDISKSECMLKLQRNTLDLQQLETKMASYVCEPNTYELFNKCQSILHNLRKLKKKNQELIQTVQLRKQLQITELESTIRQVRDFVDLSQSAHEYQKLLR
tara:strand:+ start:326 stop:664 length:339 start_codon:yes stop_codon:yes gene_type:complete